MKKKRSPYQPKLLEEPKKRSPYQPRRLVKPKSPLFKRHRTAYLYDASGRARTG